MVQQEVDPIKVRMHIGGVWMDSGADPAELRSPVDGTVRSLVAEGSREHAREAVGAAASAKRSMAALPTEERSGLCRAIADVIEQRHESLAENLSLEQGKPVTEARAEVLFAAQLFRDAAAAIGHLTSEILPGRDSGKRVLTLRQPHGVVGVITPWNFPMAIPSEYLSAAVVTGNTVVWKPAPTTPHTAASLLECMLEAGLPDGVVNVVYGDAEIGDEIVTNPDVQAVGFTGSAQIGELVAQRAGAKPLLLELGGNGPTVILDDADLEYAIPAVAQGSFVNAGQTCQSTERILVGRQVHDAVVEGLVREAAKLRLGHPLENATTMGPLNNDAVATKMDQHIADAIARDAVILSGGRRADGFSTPLYYEPTVVDGLTPDSLLNLEETFGPIAPVLTVDDVDEAIAIANLSELGLCGAVFSQDLGTALYCAEQLECGVVNINEHAAYWDGRTPFGGYSGKRSGVGRLGGVETLLSLTQLKSLVLDVPTAPSASGAPRNRNLKGVGG